MPKPIEVISPPSRVSETIRVYNHSKRKLSLQVKPPAGDFFLHEQQVHLFPGKSVLLPKECTNPDQIQNLRAKGFLKVLHDG